MKRISKVFISLLLMICLSGILTYVSGAGEGEALYLESFESYADKAAIGETCTNYAYGGTGTLIDLNTEAANSQGNTGKSLKITSTAEDPFGAVVISNMEFLEGYEGATVWVKNPSKYSVGFHFLITYTAWPKKNKPFYIKADGDTSFTEIIAFDKTYYNIEIAPGFAGELRFPFSSFNGPVTGLNPIVIQTSIGEQTYDEPYTLYIDSIGIYGLAGTTPEPTSPAGTPAPTITGEGPQPTKSADPTGTPSGGTGTSTTVLDSFDSYSDTAALTNAGYTINPYAASAAATTVSLNTDPSNSFEGYSALVKLDDENRNPSFQNSYNIIEGAAGFEFWFYNPNQNACSIYISYNWGPFIKASSDYYVKDQSVNDQDYVKRTTADRQYFNMEFAPGFKGFIRLPFASCSDTVDSLASTSIQIWSLGDDTPGKGNSYYFDNISLYGLKEQAVPTTDKITSIVITSNTYAFVPRIKDDKFVMNLTADGYNVHKEIKTSHSYVWALKNSYKGVTLTPAGILTIDETAELGEITVICTVKYNANGQLDKSLEFKMNLSPGDSLLTSTGATMSPPKPSSKDYFKP